MRIRRYKEVGVTFIFLLFGLAQAAEAGQSPRGNARFLEAAGIFEAAVEWTIDPGPRTDVLHGSLSFLPGAGAGSCSRIGFVQIAKVLANNGKDYVWEMGESPRNDLATANGHYYVDHLAENCKRGAACSAFFADYWPNEGESRFGRTGKEPEAATLGDYPFGWEIVAKQSLEACAVCADDLRTFGCLRWGGGWLGTGGQKIDEISYTSTPSLEFLEAVANFRKFYSGSAVMRSSGKASSKRTGGPR